MLWTWLCKKRCTHRAATSAPPIIRHREMFTAKDSYLLCKKHEEKMYHWMTSFPAEHGQRSVSSCEIIHEYFQGYRALECYGGADTTGSHPESEHHAYGPDLRTQGRALPYIHPWWILEIREDANTNTHFRMTIWPTETRSRVNRRSTVNIGRLGKNAKHVIQTLQWVSQLARNIYDYNIVQEINYNVESSTGHAKGYWMVLKLLTAWLSLWCHI